MSESKRLLHCKNILYPSMSFGQVIIDFLFRYYMNMYVTYLALTYTYVHLWRTINDMTCTITCCIIYAVFYLGRLKCLNFYHFSALSHMRGVYKKLLFSLVALYLLWIWMTQSPAFPHAHIYQLQTKLMSYWYERMGYCLSQVCRRNLRNRLILKLFFLAR